MLNSPECKQKFERKKRFSKHCKENEKRNRETFHI